MKKRILTTKHDFEIFRKECLLWINKYKIGGWDITYAHEEMEKDVAQCTTDPIEKYAILKLGKNWGGKWDILNSHEVKYAARHEVRELLLSPLIYLAESRFTTKNEIHAARHSIIHSLECAG